MNQFCPKNPDTLGYVIEKDYLNNTKTTAYETAHPLLRRPCSGPPFW